MLHVVPLLRPNLLRHSYLLPGHLLSASSPNPRLQATCHRQLPASGGTAAPVKLAACSRIARTRPAAGRLREDRARLAHKHANTPERARGKCVGYGRCGSGYLTWWRMVKVTMAAIQAMPSRVSEGAERKTVITLKNCRTICTENIPRSPGGWL